LLLWMCCSSQSTLVEEFAFDKLQMHNCPLLMCKSGIGLNFAVFSNPVVNSQVFPHRNLQKHTWTSSDGKMYSQINHILVGRNGIRFA
jgi:hypothetical protein